MAVSGLILAGGKGSRLGSEKGLVPLAGRPLVSWVAAALRPLVDRLVVSIPYGASGEPYVAALGSGTEGVPDRAAARGPLEGILASLPGLGGEWVCLAPCDTPFLRPDIYRVLKRAASGRDGAAPRVEELQPLIGIFGAPALYRAATRASKGPDRSPTAALKSMDLALLGPEGFLPLDPELLFLFNINTPQDLERAEAIAGRKPTGPAIEGDPDLARRRLRPGD